MWVSRIFCRATVSHHSSIGQDSNLDSISICRLNGIFRQTVLSFLFNDDPSPSSLWVLYLGFLVTPGSVWPARCRHFTPTSRRGPSLSPAAALVIISAPSYFILSRLISVGLYFVVWRLYSRPCLFISLFLISPSAHCCRGPLCKMLSITWMCL